MDHTEPRIEYREKRPYVSIRIQVPLKEWSQANALVNEVFAWVSQRGIEMAGALFYRYWVIGGIDKPFDIEVGLPVRRRIEGDGRVMAGSMPAGTYATVVHQGHPDRILLSHEVLREWVRSQGLAAATEIRDGETVWQGRFESYLTNPAVQPDPNEWSTELAYLLENS